MTLEDFISDMGRRAELALAVGSSSDYLWQIATNRRRASHALAKRIEDATCGEVTRHDLRPDIFGPAPASDQVAA